MRILQILLLVIATLFSSSISASDIIINIDPNPALTNQPVRISVVTEFDVQKANLKIGKKTYPLKRVSNKLHRVNLTALEEFNRQKPILLITQNNNTLKLPVRINVKKKTQIANFSLDSTQATELSVDNSKIEINRLQDKVDVLDQKNSKLNKEIEDLKNKIASEAASKKELKEQQSMLKKLQLQLEEDEKQKNEAIKKLKEEMNEFNEKQTKLQKKEAILTELEQSLSTKTKDIESQSQKLSSKEALLTSKESALASKQENLKERQETLSKLQSEVNNKKKKLKTKQQIVSKKEKALTTKSQKLKQKESSLATEKKKINQLSSQISKKRQRLISKQKELDISQEKLKKERKKIYKNAAEKDKEIKRQEIYIKSLQKNLVKEISKVSNLDEQYIQQMKQVQQETNILRQERIRYENEKSNFEDEKKAIKDLELEISIRLEMLKKLGDYIDSQLNELKNQIAASKSQQSTYESDVNKKITHLNNLTRLIEKRASKIESYNIRLLEANTKLKERIRNLKEKNYRYGISPYLGRRIDETTKKSSTEYGLDLSAYFKSRYHLSTGVGLNNYLRKQGDITTNVHDTRYALGLGILLNPNEILGFYLKSTTHFIDTKNETGVTIKTGGGVTLKYKGFKRFTSLFSLDYTDNFLIRFGIEKHLIPLDKQTEEQIKNFKISTKKKVVDDVFITLTPIKKHYQYFQKKITYNDVKGWYKSAALNTTSQGVFPYEINKTTTFRPKEILTFEEAAYGLTWAYFIEESMKPKPIEIPFTITTDSDTNVNITIEVKDQTGKTISTILDKKQYYPGSYNVFLSPKKAGLKEGKYTIICKSFEKLVTNPGDEYEVKNVLTASASTELEIIAITNLEQHPTLKHQISYKKKNPYINFIKNKKWITKNTKSSELNSKKMTRLDFILASSKFLITSGSKKRNVSIDFSPYKDWSSLPKDAREYLATYVLELGYGGDVNKKLNPNKLITRAEAAVIFNRLLNWKHQQQ